MRSQDTSLEYPQSYFGRLKNSLFQPYSKFVSAMSSSRSDNVTKCVCLWGVNWNSFEYSKHLKLDVSRELQGCFPGVARVSLRCSKSIEGVSRKLQGWLKDVSWMFQGSFRRISRGVLYFFQKKRGQAKVSIIIPICLWAAPERPLENKMQWAQLYREGLKKNT